MNHKLAFEIEVGLLQQGFDELEDLIDTVIYASRWNYDYAHIRIFLQSIPENGCNLMLEPGRMPFHLRDQLFKELTCLAEDLIEKYETLTKAEKNVPPPQGTA